jgi:nucleolar protein 56
MRAYLATGILGSFAFDSSGRTIAYRLFPKRPDVIAGRLMKSRAGGILPEELEIVRELARKGYRELVWSKDKEVRGINCIRKREHLGEEVMQGSYRKLALDLKWVSSQAELNEILSRVNVEMTKTELRRERRDQIIMRVVSVLDELEKELNVFSEKLREWYGLHFPEASSVIPSHERYAGLVARHGRRESVKDRELAKLAGKSSGMEFPDHDMEEVQAFSKALLGLYDVRKRLASYLEDIARSTVPNTSAVAGPVLAARLLVLSGGLEKLSKLPSSTIQLLGAEKALFRHLKGEGKAPKYGVLFGHPLIQAAPRELRGKVARLVAARVALAARLDKFSGRDEGEKMRRELEEQARRILTRPKTKTRAIGRHPG